MPSGEELIVVHRTHDNSHSTGLVEPAIGLQHQNVLLPIARLYNIHPSERALCFRRLNLMAFFVPNFEYWDWHRVAVKLLFVNEEFKYKR